jgi:hypothetical protein
MNMKQSLRDISKVRANVAVDDVQMGMMDATASTTFFAREAL